MDKMGWGSKKARMKRVEVSIKADPRASTETVRVAAAVENSSKGTMANERVFELIESAKRVSKGEKGTDE
jgi:hypothetical protein